MDSAAYTAAVDTWTSSTKAVIAESLALLPGQPLTALGLARATAHARLDAIFDAETRPHLRPREEVHGA